MSNNRRHDAQTITRRQFTLGAALTGVALALPQLRSTAAAQEGDLAGLGLPTIDVTITADSFEGIPETLEAGRYLLNVTAEDVEEGSAVAFLQPYGMSAEEFFMALGGGAPAGPGMPGMAVIDLTEGEWIAWGDEPEAAQMPVVVMVTGEFPADAPDPGGDIMATLVDFGIMMEGDLTAGERVIRVENLGAQPHFLELATVPVGTTNDDLAALLDSFMTGTPVPDGLTEEDFGPGTYTPTQSIGTVTWTSVTLEAGTYAAMCWFPTSGIGDPHVFHGMYTVFEVS